MILYSFINLPHHFTYDNVINFFYLESNQFSRLYKQSLFWVLVSENEEFNSNEKTAFYTKDKIIRNFKIIEMNNKFKNGR